MKKFFLVALITLAGLKFSHAQSDVADMLRFGTHDANLLINAYVEPYAKGLGVGMNNSWYFTAETHKLWGFDLAFSVSAFKVPGSDKTFDVNELGLQHVYAREGQSIASTAAGSGDGVSLYYDAQINGQTMPEEYFSTPGGSGVDVVPVPVIQATFGLLPNTDVILRYVPKVEFEIDNEDAEAGLWGLGLKHNIRESLPVIRHLPMDVALFGAYSNISGESGIDFDYTVYGDDVPNPAGYVQDPNQKGEFTTKNMKYGLIVSKKIAVITFFASVTGNSSKTSFDILGKYPVPDPTKLGTDITNIDELLLNAMTEEEDPIALSYKDNYMGIDAGFRLKLAFFSLFGSISKANYVSYNGGISFGFR
ncbi:hypothetical protein SAMN05444285_111111 [Draconibacterium orientale]|uniref:Uncharacterized protein n=1 Tax=Draconibacterium orientale TaxID=1168034 RepID=X5DP07_9BACT|nr:DUF6588 family protein [Draconibacterium orientale]AHW62382.1 hypothetical protein FH5T_20585 [Draconibacterium orientale]SET37154.1 hypothetical protein SAMN05444285_111111 [Draconibacterium orientale]